MIAISCKLYSADGRVVPVSIPRNTPGSFMFHLPLASTEEAADFITAVGGSDAGGAVELVFGSTPLGSWLFPEDESKGLVHVKSGYCALKSQHLLPDVLFSADILCWRRVWLCTICSMCTCQNAHIANTRRLQGICVS